MAGNKSGGLKSAQTILQRDPEFYKRIGAIGGRKGTTGGYWHAKYIQEDVEFIRLSGAKGGRKSRRGKSGA